MNESSTVATNQKHAGPSRTIHALAARDLAEFKSLAFRLELQSMQALLTVLANVARLGCTISQLTAIDCLVNLHIVAPTRLAHRVESCVAQIIGVLSVSSVLSSEGQGTAQ